MANVTDERMQELDRRIRDYFDSKNAEPVGGLVLDLWRELRRAKIQQQQRAAD
jgi:hypothetical protein